jgi:hypothetical protein
MKRAWGTFSCAAPSCRRADATALESLPEKIGELKKLKNLCVAARSVRFTLGGRGVSQCGAGSLTGATLRSSPTQSATSQSQACTRGPQFRASLNRGVGIQSGQARAALQGRVEQCPPRATGVRVQDGQPNVAVRAVIIVEACVAAPSRALLPQERGAQRAAGAA